MESILPELKRLLRLVTVVVVFSVFFVMGIIISMVEGAFVYDELGHLEFTPLLFCGLVLTGISTLALSYLFLIKDWAPKIHSQPIEYPPPTQRPAEQHGYRPVDTQL